MLSDRNKEMNIRDLLNKIDTLAEADDARAQYDKFKADDAKASAVAQVKSMTKPNGNANFIDPKDGIIKYQDRGGDSDMGGSIKPFPYDWYKKGQEGQFFGLLKAAGLEVIPVEKKQLFGTFQVAGVDPAKLATLGQEVAPTPVKQDPKPVTPTGPRGAGPAEDIAKLNALSSQLMSKLEKTPVKESKLAESLIESFGYVAELTPPKPPEENNDLRNLGIGAGAGLVGGKLLGKAIPGLGLGIGAADAYNRAKKGDWLGAGMAGASGIASLIPGPGTAVALGLDAANIGRDIKKGEFDDTIAAVKGLSKSQDAKPVSLKPGADPKVYALQQKLVSAGAKITADGFMGPATQAAMKQFPSVKESVAESMAGLRDRLAVLEREQREYATDEGYGDYVKGASDLGKNLWKGLQGKAAQGSAKTPAELQAMKDAWNAKRVAAGKKPFSDADFAARAKNTGQDIRMPSKAQTTVNTAGQKVHMNPGKTAAAAGAAGLGLGYALSTGKKDEPVDPTKQDPKPIPGPKPTPTPTPVDADVQDIIKQMKEIMGHDWSGSGADEQAAWGQATSNAMSLIGKAEKGNAAQVAQDRQTASQMPVAGTTPTVASAKPVSTDATGLPDYLQVK
jgi:ElaB/YqjD/DUF883 family membrane-anchored ribosome-binding protein